MKISRFLAGLAIACALAPLGASGAPGAPVRAWRGPIVIPTYLLGSADPNPPFPLLHSSPVYPYEMLDSLTNKRVPKTYRAIYLENKYLKLTILPALGGHLYSIYDKVDHREVLYRNHVVKYGLIGPRGAWISGGVEFSFPFAHTDVTVSPVESTLRHNADGSATAVVGAVDWVSNMHWEVALTLRPDAARVEQRVTLFNATPARHLYLFWANGAVKATDDMQYIYPMRETITDNPFGVVQSWPVWQGVNRSWYKNNPSAMAIFARDSHRDFFGVYYHQSNYGVVHVANFRQDPGKKVWTWGTADSGLIWQHILSDDDGPYNEIQSGRFYTQGYREFMPPRRVENWTEYWYPVHGLDGGFVDATPHMAVNTVFSNGNSEKPEVKLVMSPVEEESGATVAVSVGSRPVRNISNVDFTPLQPVSFTIPVESLGSARKSLNVRITSAKGRTLLQWSAAAPVNGNPDFVPEAGTRRKKLAYTATTPVEELYLHGQFLQKRGDLDAAVKVYDEVLQRDPDYVPALLKEAWLAYAATNFKRAESLATRAQKRGLENPAVDYTRGVIYRAEGRLSLAQDALWSCLHYGGKPEPALVELGEIAIHQQKYGQAAALLRRAAGYNPGDALALADLAAANRLAGDVQKAAQVSAEAVQKMPLLPYALAEQWMNAGGVLGGVADQAPMQQGNLAWTKVVNSDPQNYIAVAAWYHNLGAWRSSDAVLRVAEEQNDSSPMVQYYLASNARHEGNARQAEQDARKAASLPCEEVFPNRITDAAVLREAIEHNPQDSHAKYALGNFLFAHRRYQEAASLWTEALHEGFNNPVLLRNLGVYAWRVKVDLPEAAGYYARAIKLSPNDFSLYTDADEIYAEQGDSAARVSLFHSAPAAALEQDPVRARYALFLIEQGKLRQALDLLRNHEFKPWEGGVEIHVMFARALLEQGKKLLSQRRLAEATRDFREAMTYPRNLGVGKPYQPDDAEPLYWLGISLEAQGKMPGALAAWRRAAPASEPMHNGERGFSDGQVFSALALRKLGKTGQAQAMLEHCAQSSAAPDAGAYGYYVAGLAEGYSGRAAKARDQLRRALEINPLFWQARVALKDLPASSGGEQAAQVP